MNIIPSKEYSKCKGPKAGRKLLFLSGIKKEAGKAVLGEQGREWREIRSEWEAGLDLVASCIYYDKDGEEYHTKLVNDIKSLLYNQLA